MLIVAPFFGEFGWQLMRWQGFVRAECKKRGERPVVMCEEGYEYLYHDFASVIYGVPFPERALRDMYHCVIPDSKMAEAVEQGITVNGYHISAINPGSYLKTKELEQDFIAYGVEDEREDIVLIHARAAQHSYRNWSIDNWNKLIELLNMDSMDVICVGTKNHSVHINKTFDMRGINLRELCRLMRRASVLVSPSSGVPHLASLCKLPHVVWADNRRWAQGFTNKERYKEKWNPFHTPCTFIEDKDWNPTPAVVMEAICPYL